MKIYYPFLKDYLDTDFSAKKMADIFTNLGLECESSNKTLNFDITPNRGDALSLSGLAREFSASQKNARFIQKPFNKVSFQNSKDYIGKVNNKCCQNYHLLEIREINKFKALPKEIVRLLEKADIPLIHPVVDIGNYVMLELGTPLHVFDRDKLTLPLSVNFADENETVSIIGGEKKILDSSIATIRDRNATVAIAGIIGCDNSSVTSETKNFLVESAAFLPNVIMNKARKLSLNTDASLRFERGVDSTMQANALVRFLELLNTVTSVKFKNFYKFKSKNNLSSRKIKFNYEDLNAFAGKKIPPRFVDKLLKNLGFTLSKNKQGFYATVPSHRFDISIKEDIYEEVLRVYGFDKLPANLPLAGPSNLKTSTSYVQRISNFLIANGYQELMHLPFVQKTYVNEAKSISLTNPINNEESYLRDSLFFSMINSLANNYKKGLRQAKFFEVGKLFSIQSKKYMEEECISGIIFKCKKTKFWMTEPNFDFFYMKQEIFGMLNFLGFDDEDFSYERENKVNMFFGKNSLSVRLRNQKDPFLYIGVIDHLYTKEISETDVIGFEFNLMKFKSIQKKKKISLPSVFPFAERDLNLLIPKDLPFKDISHAIKSLNSPFLKRFEVIDLFEDENLGSKNKSITIRFVLQSKQKSLTDEEINQTTALILTLLKQKFSIALKE